MKTNFIMFLSALSIIFICGCECEKDILPTSCIDPNKINNNAACITIYKPVCGCNNKTYSNACVANASGVISWVEGPCKN